MAASVSGINERFESSYRRLFGEDIASQGDEAFFQDFYDRFFSHSEETRSMFRNTDMAHQRTALRRSLFDLVTFYATGIVSARLRRIAQVHQDLHFRPELYDVWLDALISCVEEHDPACDEMTSLAWRLALTPGVTYMKLWHQTDISPLDGP